jgi:hypothetical protein
MNKWQQESLGAALPASTPPSRLRYTSPPLVRMFAGIAFTAAGIGTWNIGSRLLGVEWTQPKWGAASIMLYVGSMAAASIAGLIGVAAGMAVPVHGRRTNFILAVIWHYTANGTAIWIMLLVMVTQKTFGREGMKALVHRSDAQRIVWMTMAIGACGSLVIGVLLMLARTVRDSGKPKAVASIVIALPVAFAMSRAMTALLPEIGRLALFLTLALPLPLVFISAHFIQRDLRQRRQLVPEG